MNQFGSGALGYFRTDTIAALASSVGGAISIIRISGPKAISVLMNLSRLDPKAQPERGKLQRTALFLESGKPLDDAMSVCFYAPHSFSGEDLVELHLHGGAYIAQRVLETLSSMGICQALPGEFSFRAVRNGKMNVYQAQAIHDLITAQNDTAIHIAIEKLSGLHNQKLFTLAQDIRQLASLGELGIDFSDQDVEEVSLPSLKKRASAILEVLGQLEKSFDRGTKIQEGIRVVFLGLPNAGKSTLFNALLGEDRSIVSEQAGTTRDVVREKLTLRGKTSTVTLRLEDTAGLRTTDHTIEKMGIDRTHAAARNADLIFFLVDPTAPFEAVESEWTKLKDLTQRDLSPITLGMVTKSDLVTTEKVNECLAKLQSRFGISRLLVTSAQSGTGIEEAIESIVSLCEKQTLFQAGEILLTRLDHLNAVRKASADLKQALEATEVDLFAADIRQALHSISPLIGLTSTDDLLEKIFSDFCIGK